MIEPDGSIEPGDDVRQLHLEPPLVRSTARLRERGAPRVPPARRAFGDRLDNQHPIAPRTDAVEQSRQEQVARRARQLVHRERRHDRRWAVRKRKGGDVGLTRDAVEAERAVRARGFRQCPAIPVHADDTPSRHGGSGGSGAAAEVDDLARAATRAQELRGDVTDEKKVQRRIEQRERRAFAGARQRRALGDPVAPLDVVRRQRTQCARQLRKRQLAEVTLFQVGQPVFERCVDDSRV